MRVRRPPARTSKMGPEEVGSSQEVQCWRQASRGWRRRRAAASMTQGASLASAPGARWPHAPRRVRGPRTTTGKSQPVRLRYSVTCDAPLRTAPASCWQVATKQLPREPDADVTHVKEAGDEAADGPLAADACSDDAHACGPAPVVADATTTNAANVANVASARILTPARASTSAATDAERPRRNERRATARLPRSSTRRINCRVCVLFAGPRGGGLARASRSWESRPLRCVSRAKIARAANYGSEFNSHLSPTLSPIAERLLYIARGEDPPRPRVAAREEKSSARASRSARLTLIFPRHPPHPLPRVPSPSTPRRRA